MNPLLLGGNNNESIQSGNKTKKMFSRFRDSNTDRANYKKNKTNKIRTSGNMMKELIEKVFNNINSKYNQKYNIADPKYKKITTDFTNSKIAAEKARLAAELERRTAETSRIESLKKNKELLKNIVRQKFFENKKLGQEDNFKVFDGIDGFDELNDLKAHECIVLIDKAFEEFENYQNQKDLKTILEDIQEDIKDIQPDPDDSQELDLNKLVTKLVGKMKLSKEKKIRGEMKVLDQKIEDLNENQINMGVVEDIKKMIDRNGQYGMSIITESETDKFIKNKIKVYTFLLHTFELHLFIQNCSSFILKQSEQNKPDKFISTIQRFICELMVKNLEEEQTTISGLFETRSSRLASTIMTVNKVLKYKLLNTLDIKNFRALLGDIDTNIQKYFSNYTLDQNIEGNLLPSIHSIEINLEYKEILFPIMKMDREKMDTQLSDKWKPIIDKIKEIKKLDVKDIDPNGLVRSQLNFEQTQRKAEEQQLKVAEQQNIETAEKISKVTSAMENKREEWERQLENGTKPINPSGKIKIPTKSQPENWEEAARVEAEAEAKEAARVEAERVEAERVKAEAKEAEAARVEAERVKAAIKNPQLSKENIRSLMKEKWNGALHSSNGSNGSNGSSVATESRLKELTDLHGISEETGNRETRSSISSVTSNSGSPFNGNLENLPPTNRSFTRLNPTQLRNLTAKKRQANRRTNNPLFSPGNAAKQAGKTLSELAKQGIAWSKARYEASKQAKQGTAKKVKGTTIGGTRKKSL